MERSKIAAPILMMLTFTLLLASFAMASVFVYYPLTINISPQPPGVVFEPGKNANQADIGIDKSITVNLGHDKTSATITIHPTYQENYYKNVTLIVNNDDSLMNVYLIVRDTNITLLPFGSNVTLFIYSGDYDLINALDITSPSTNTDYFIGSLSENGVWQIDIYVKIPEGTNVAGLTYQVKMSLVYTPSEETPVVTPSQGRQA